MALEPDEDMPVEKIPKEKSQIYEKAMWWVILAVVILLIILLYSCRIAIK